MRTTLRAAAGVALAILLHSNSQAQQPNLFIYGNYEEPYGACPLVSTGVVQLAGTGCYDVQKWPSCGGRWWAWQRQDGNTVTPGVWPYVMVSKYAANQSTPIPVSGNRMIRIYTNASAPIDTITTVMYQRLGAPLTSGVSYFMRWRFKALKSPTAHNQYKFEVVHGNDNGIPCTPVPAPSLTDYPFETPFTDYENQTVNFPLLDNQVGFTFTAIGGENYVALRITTTKTAPLFAASNLWIDDLELYDAGLPIPSAMMVQNGEVQALRMIDESPSFSAVPNPTSGLISVNTAGIPTNSPLLVLASDGRVVRSLRTTDEARLDIDLTAEPAGLYTIRISDGERNEVLRVVKE